jgi:S1-C subfamily serine protease
MVGARSKRASPALVLALLLAAAAAAGCDEETAPQAPAATTAARTAPETEPPAVVVTTVEVPGESTFDRIPAIVTRLRPSIVTVIVETPTGSGEGSGVVWDEDGTIVTNNHVVEGATEVSVTLASGERLPAEVRATDPLTDLAVLAVERTGLPPATFSTTLPQVGELAIAMGSPLGFENSVTAGIVSAVHRSIPSGGQTPALVDLLQTDAPISPGNSGGALVGADGEVIGINVAYIPPEQQAVSIGFAIPSPTVVSVVRQLLETGHVEHAFLGVEPRDVTAEVARELGLPVSEGVLVFAVVPDSAAAKAGLEAGDVLVALDGEPLRTVEDLFGALRERAPGDVVRLTILRGGQELELAPILTDRPEQ